MTPQHLMLKSIEKALVDAGELACPTHRSRTTGRLRFIPDAEGFRITTSFDPAFVPDNLCTSARSRLCVGHAGHPRRVLERYQDILRTAGFDVRIDGGHHYKTRPYVWINRVYDEYENETVNDDELMAKKILQVKKLSDAASAFADATLEWDKLSNSQADKSDVAAALSRFKRAKEAFEKARK